MTEPPDEETLHTDETTASLREGKPLGFPFQARHVVDPPPILAHLREDHPLVPVRLPTGTPALLVTRWEDTKAVLTDHRLSREALSKPSDTEIIPYEPTSIVPPSEYGHGLPYRQTGSSFHAKHVDHLRPRTRKLTDTLLDELLAQQPPADLIKHVAKPLAETVIGEIMGIPASDRAWVDAQIPLATPSTPSTQSETAGSELFAYFRDLFETKRNSPADDLMSSMATGQLSPQLALEPSRIIALCVRICMASMHAVHAAIGKSAILLLRQPEIFSALGRHPHLTKPVTEELIRLSTPIPATLPRLATDDAEFPCGTIPKGSIVIASLEAANRDPQHFTDPDRKSVV